MLAVLTIGALVLAAVVGLALRRRTGPTGHARDKDAVDVPKVLGSTSLLAGLLIAIVLANASETYSAAKTAAKTEASTADNISEAAEYVRQPYRQRLQAAVVCYARAVAGPEWDSMARGIATLSPVPSNWTGTKPGGIRRTLIELTAADPAFQTLHDADAARGDQRRQRVAEAAPAVPTILYAFMIFLLALSVSGLAYSIPRPSHAAQLAALATVTVLFSIVMLLIANFDRPFSGVLAYGPQAMKETARQDAEAYQASYGKPPPCDANGYPAKYLLALRKAA